MESEEAKMRKVKVMQRSNTGVISEEIIETNETREKLLNHLHILEIIEDEQDEKEELVGDKETKSKKTTKKK